MTRFARAKGSKSSNERLPNEPTPWHVMKQQLEVALAREKDQDTKTITKSAKQLLSEKDDLYYTKSLGNVNADWAEFESSKSNGIVTNGKVEKKPKGQNKKVKKALEQAVEEKNVTPAGNPDNNNVKNKKVKKAFKKMVEEENVTPVVNSDNGNIKSKKVKKAIEKVVEEKSLTPGNFDGRNLKNKKRKNEESNDEHNGFEQKELKQENDDPNDNSLNQLKIKKRIKKEKSKANKVTEESVKVEVKLENTSETKTDDHKESSNKLSKRQKRNQKKQSQKNGNESQSTNSKAFNVEGDDWNCSVKFGQKNGNQNNKNINSKKQEKPKKWLSDFDWNNWRRFGDNVPKKFQKQEAKPRDNQEYRPRKSEVGSMKVTINGMDVEITKYDGFPVKKEDAERLKELRKEMTLKGIPQAEIDAAMKLERRKCEKALARIRKQVCFHCRKAGHNLSDCPELEKEEVGTGICFKCGSTEHTHFECKVTKSDDYRFAKCFICREQGHIAKQCPDNPKGLYPDGGGCKICGDVTHLKKDCPDLVKEKEETAITLDTIKDDNLELLDNESVKTKPIVKSIRKIVKF